MRLPNADQVIVSEAKIVDYLLNPEHPVGRSKARFFLRHGFTAEEWLRLAQVLRQHALENPVAQATQTMYGKRYALDGLLLAPDGRRLNVRSAWFIQVDGSVPRFVTAHPLPKI